MRLEIEGLSVGYGGTTIIRGVSFSVEAGEVVSVMGKNGVGKTTLLKTIMGILDPQAGTISYGGEDITDRAADERARLGIGYVPQGRDVFPGLSVEENLLVGENVGDEVPCTTASTSTSRSSRNGRIRTPTP